VTTEDDFNRQLDANPEDHHTRLVFADWLEERDDPRAEGSRALGLLGKRSTEETPRGWLWHQAMPRRVPAPCDLPTDWFYALVNTGGVGLYPTPCPTRREAEDAAARAFATLPPVLESELLTPREQK
jgi:uncharacterized protein (TIGR02996 family)